MEGSGPRNLVKVLGPDPVAEDKLFGLEPWTITALGREGGPLLGHYWDKILKA